VKVEQSIGIYGEFKVTVKPVLQTDQYPLTRAEDIFPSLAGGQEFSKIDLANAYQQMRVTPECCQFLTINTIEGQYQYIRLMCGIASVPGEQLSTF